MCLQASYMFPTNIYFVLWSHCCHNLALGTVAAAKAIVERNKKLNSKSHAKIQNTDVSFQFKFKLACAQLQRNSKLPKRPVVCRDRN
jgi:hypothetical protein